MRDKQAVQSFNIEAKIIFRPEFKNTLHDNETAKALGYPAALVPGIDVYARLTSLIITLWGREWLSRGRLSYSALRPVYDGEMLRVTFASTPGVDTSRRAKIELFDSSGTLVGSAEAELGDVAAATPDLGRYAIRERTGSTPPGNPEALSVGLPFTCIPDTVSAERNRNLCAEFLEEHDFYQTNGIVHPAYLQRLALHTAHSSFAHATPPIFISTDTQNFGTAKVDEVLHTPGVIEKLWEKNGHHYMESTQLVLAAKVRPVALIRRVTIYQARQSN